MDGNSSSATPRSATERFDAQELVIGQSFVSISPTYHRWKIKSWLERSVAAIGLIITSPFVLLLIILIRATSEGPAVYWQKRVGLGGRIFLMCKLRTMTLDAEEWTGAVWAQENDPRVTKVGAVLRKLHLDEIVQFWNILQGEMAFVGPRPERPEIAQELSEEIPGYAHRWMVLPGVTGLAQVNLSPDQTVDCVRKKLELDLEYIFTAEPTLDLRIIGCTILKMLGIPRKVASKAFVVARTPEPARRAFSTLPQEVFEFSVNGTQSNSLNSEATELETESSNLSKICSRT